MKTRPISTWACVVRSATTCSGDRKPAACSARRACRNTAVRPSYFHNGVFHSLGEVVDYYNTRDTEPGRWYPTVDGKVQVFNDLPPDLRANVTHLPPFGARRMASR